MYPAPMLGKTAKDQGATGLGQNCYHPWNETIIPHPKYPARPDHRTTILTHCIFSVFFVQKPFQWTIILSSTTKCYPERQTMKLHRNMHPLDQLIRLIIGVVLVYIGFFNREVISDPILGALVGILGCLNLVSSFSAVCPLYLMANISSAGLFKSRHG